MNNLFASSSGFFGFSDVFDFLIIGAALMIGFKIHNYRPQLVANGSFFSKVKILFEKLLFEKILRLDLDHANEEKALYRAILYVIASACCVGFYNLKFSWIIVYGLLASHGIFADIGLLLFGIPMALNSLNIVYALHVIVPWLVKGFLFFERSRTRLSTRINDGSGK
jgi:hypothetical protein